MPRGRAPRNKHRHTNQPTHEHAHTHTRTQPRHRAAASKGVRPFVNANPGPKAQLARKHPCAFRSQSEGTKIHPQPFDDSWRVLSPEVIPFILSPSLIPPLRVTTDASSLHWLIGSSLPASFATSILPGSFYTGKKAADASQHV